MAVDLGANPGGNLTLFSKCELIDNHPDRVMTDHLFTPYTETVVFYSTIDVAERVGGKRMVDDGHLKGK